MLDTRVWLYCTSSLNKNACCVRCKAGISGGQGVCALPSRGVPCPHYPRCSIPAGCARERPACAQAPSLRVCRRRLTLPAAQAAVDSVVAQISGVAAAGSRLCLDAVPLGLVEGRIKPRRGWINGRDVRGPTPSRAPRAQPSAHSISSLLGAAH